MISHFFSIPLRAATLKLLKQKSQKLYPNLQFKIRLFHNRTICLWKNRVLCITGINKWGHICIHPLASSTQYEAALRADSKCQHILINTVTTFTSKENISKMSIADYHTFLFNNYRLPLTRCLVIVTQTTILMAEI